MANGNIKILGNGQEVDITLHTKMYDEIVKDEELVQNIIKRWENFGFLQGLEGETKTKVAVMHEQMASFLMDENVGYDFSNFIDNMNYKKACQLSRYCNFEPTFSVDKRFEETFETIIFPIIYRTLPKTNKVVEFNDFMALFDVIKDDDNFFFNAIKKAEDENKNYDMEAEYCAYISNKLTEKINEE